MHACVYVCMFGVQPADPVTFLLLLQTNVATTTTRVRDDRRHFLRCLSTESGRYKRERENWKLVYDNVGCERYDIYRSLPIAATIVPTHSRP